MSSSEIEDVLSSIRRLVSEEMRPLVRSRPAPAAAASAAPAAPVAAAPASAPEPGKLLLTPALRIVPRAAPVVAARPAPEPQPAPDLQPAPALSVPAAAVVADAAQAPASPPPGPLPVFIATRRVHLVDTPEAPFTEAEPAPIERVVASLGAAVTAHPDDWEPEHGDAPLDTGFAGEGWAMPDISFDLEPEVMPIPVAAATPVPSPEPQPEVAQADDVPAWAQQDTIIEIEEQVEPAPDPVRAMPEPDSAWADAAEASIIASLRADVEIEAVAPHMPEAAPGTAGAEPDEMRFNEDVLRELVRDILREELAGHIGERITRNIRKLVRAEISTLLAAQELE